MPPSRVPGILPLSGTETAPWVAFFWMGTIVHRDSTLTV